MTLIVILNFSSTIITFITLKWHGIPAKEVVYKRLGVRRKLGNLLLVQKKNFLENVKMFAAGHKILDNGQEGLIVLDQ